MGNEETEDVEDRHEEDEHQVEKELEQHMRAPEKKKKKKKKGGEVERKEEKRDDKKLKGSKVVWLEGSKKESQIVIKMDKARSKVVE